MTGLAVLGALAAVMLKRQHQALGWAAAAFAGAAVLLLALDKLGEAADVLRELAQCAQLQEGQLALILRILAWRWCRSWRPRPAAMLARKAWRCMLKRGRR